MKVGRQFVRGALGSFALNFCSKLLMLVASVLLARLLGPAGYGIYAAAIAAALLLGVLAALGIPTLILRLVAVYHASAEWALMRGLLAAGNRAILASTLAVAAIGVLALWTFGEQLGREHAVALWCAVALLPLIALNQARSGALRGLHHVVLAQIPECLVTPGLFVLALVVWGAFGGPGAPLSPGAAVALRVVATLSAFLVGAWFLARRLPQAARISAPACSVRRWAGSTGPLFLISAMSMINLQTDVLMLAALRGAESAGVYQAAARGAELVAFSLIVVNFALQPLISRLYTLGELAELQRVVTFSARATLALALPMAVVLGVFAGPILKTVFGAQFERGALCLAILCAAQVVIAAIGSVDHILNMTGHERDTAFGMAIGAGCNVALNAALIPLWDIEGAALASALSLLIWNVTLSLRVRRRLGIASTALGKREASNASSA